MEAEISEVIEGWIRRKRCGSHAGNMILAAENEIIINGVST